MTAPLIDTHCHLDFEELRKDFDGVIARAEAVGVRRMITVGCVRNAQEVTRAIDTANRLPERLRATVGVHPHDASRAEDAVLDAIERVAADPMVVAVGEMGLDFYYDNSPREAQQEAFRKQVGIARRVGKPIVIHTRNAPAETLDILREEGAADVGGVIHCFSEDAAFAKAALDLGFVASFSGLITFNRHTEGIREAARAQPRDAIMVETDAPYLAPVPHRGQTNEPAYVAHTADFLAELRGEDPAQLREATTENACRVFGLERP